MKKSDRSSTKEGLTHRRRSLNFGGGVPTKKDANSVWGAMKLLLQDSIRLIHGNNGQQPSPFMCKICYPSNRVSGCDPALNSSGVLSLDKVSLLSFKEDPIKNLSLLSSCLLMNLFCLFLRHTFLTVFNK